MTQLCYGLPLAGDLNDMQEVRNMLTRLATKVCRRFQIWSFDLPLLFSCQPGLFVLSLHWSVILHFLTYMHLLLPSLNFLFCSFHWA